MDTEINLKLLENNSYKRFLQDGLLEITLGIFLLAFGIGLKYDLQALAALSSIGLLLLGQLKRKITYPRLGWVKYKPGSSVERVRRWVTISLTLSSLLLLGIVSKFETLPEFFQTGFTKYYFLLGGVLIAIVCGVMGNISKIQRFYLYTLLFLICGVIVQFIIPYPTHLMILSGLIILPIGIIMLVKFLKTYPIIKIGDYPHE